jgi:acyl-coenzyme A thioesterase PaaI-like protein
MKNQGADLCHSRHSPVRISHYAVKYAPSGGVGTVLTGLCHFTERAESHRGHCHGGSMTSVMDDVVGWTAFHVTGRCCPWSGYTAQVNVSLKSPVAVGSYLTVCGNIVKWEGRKVWIQSKLVSREDDEGEEIVHCTAEGLVILMKDV